MLWTCVLISRADGRSSFSKRSLPWVKCNSRLSGASQSNPEWAAAEFQPLIESLEPSESVQQLQRDLRGTCGLVVSRRGGWDRWLMPEQSSSQSAEAASVLGPSDAFWLFMSRRVADNRVKRFVNNPPAQLDQSWSDTLRAVKINSSRVSLCSASWWVNTGMMCRNFLPWKFHKSEFMVEMIHSSHFLPWKFREFFYVAWMHLMNHLEAAFDWLHINYEKMWKKKTVQDLNSAFFLTGMNNFHNSFQLIA